MVCRYGDGGCGCGNLGYAIFDGDGGDGVGGGGGVDYCLGHGYCYTTFAGDVLVVVAM